MMNLTLPFSFDANKHLISYKENMYLLGSCFAQHMSLQLVKDKYQVAYNSHGIVFNTKAMLQSIQDVFEQKVYHEQDLLFHDGLFHSFHHHSDFSDTDVIKALKKINDSIKLHFAYLQKAKHVILSIGSAQVYYHKAKKCIVANNHKLPNTDFDTYILSSTEMEQDLNKIIAFLKKINNTIHIIITVSPVRYIKQGLIENQRSKARIVEAVQTICFDKKMAYYFPAYEIMLDVLRDYRFYQQDFSHPNEIAIDYIYQLFIEKCFNSDEIEIRKSMRKLYQAVQHKILFPESASTTEFKKKQLENVKELEKNFSYLNFDLEKKHFSS